MPTVNHPTSGRAKPRGLYPYNRDEACGHGSNAAGPEADGGEQGSQLAERGEVGNNLGDRKVESALVRERLHIVTLQMQ